jgi:hypothetical protein
MDAHVAKIIALAVPGVEFGKVVGEPADGPAVHHVTRSNAHVGTGHSEVNVT